MRATSGTHLYRREQANNRLQWMLPRVRISGCGGSVESLAVILDSTARNRTTEPQR